MTVSIHVQGRAYAGRGTDLIVETFRFSDCLLGAGDGLVWDLALTNARGRCWE